MLHCKQKEEIVVICAGKSLDCIVCYYSHGALLISGILLFKFCCKLLWGAHFWDV